MARPGVEPGTSDLRVRCPTDSATRPGLPNDSADDTVGGVVAGRGEGRRAALYML